MRTGRRKVIKYTNTTSVTCISHEMLLCSCVATWSVGLSPFLEADQQEIPSPDSGNARTSKRKFFTKKWEEGAPEKAGDTTRAIKKPHHLLLDQRKCTTATQQYFRHGIYLVVASSKDYGG